MTNPTNEQRSTIVAVKITVSYLPEAGKTAVFNHLVSQMSFEALQKASPETKAKLYAALTDYPKDKIIRLEDAATIALLEKAVTHLDNRSK